MKKDEKSNPPPATTTVVQALTAIPPTVLGRTLFPPTTAHVVALERAGCQLVLFERQFSPVDDFIAVLVLSVPGKEALQLDQAVVRAQAEAMLPEYSPGDWRDFYPVVRKWLDDSYKTHVPGKTEGGLPLAQEPAAPTGLDGQPS